MPAPERITFGPYVLERSQKRVLRGDGTALDLSPRLFNALQLFVDSAGRLIEKDALMRALWPGLVVEENNLSQVVSSLRKTLGDDSHGSRFIQTVPRRGFRFVAPVAALPDADALGAGAPAVAVHGVADGQARRALPGAAVIAASGAGDAAAPAGSTPPLGPAAGHRAGRRAVVLGLGLGAAAGTAWWVWQGRADRSAPVDGITVAVLPFKPLADEGRDELLELGMADSLAARLSRRPGLVVPSTASVLRYRGPGQDPLRAARELGVEWIVDGTLQRRGDQQRTTARLLRASTGEAAWSGSFDAKFSSVFDLQDQISAQLDRALEPWLEAGHARGGPAGDLGGTRSTEAYQLYLAARWRSQQGRVQGIDRAIELLHAALAIDRRYALAWTELAWAHRRKLWNADAEPRAVFEPANAALDRALALVPSLPQAQAGLGFTRCWFDFDWPGTEKQFRAALSANPNEVSAHHGLAMLLLTQDRIAEGFEHIRWARTLDPMSPLFQTIEGSYLVSAGRLGEAQTRLDRAFDLAPDLWLAHVAQGLLRLAEQRPEAGLASLRRAADLADGTTRPQAVLAVQLAALGQADEARELQRRLLALAKTHYVPPTSLAMVHAALDETAPALAALEQAFVVRDPRLIFLKDDPSWQRLRKEPRFIALRSRLGLDRFGPGLTPV
jgi:DNA-binding winged helix-turn-helix (wHTH) protein/TolB-like protein/Tfp pilus assembly protein PilF